MSFSQDEKDRREKRTWLCAVVFLDVVGYTKGSVEQQIKIKDHMNGVVEKSVEGIEEIDRIILDSGDGAALCFLGDPEDSLFCAVKLRDGFDLLSGQDAVKYEVRIGINLGPVKVVNDVNNRRNVLGDGINVAQRIMSFADSGQIFVSRSFYEVISCLSQEYETLFHYQGIKKDKHVREHAVYDFIIPENALINFDGNTPEINTDETSTKLADKESEATPKNITIQQKLAATVNLTYEWDPVILETAEDELTQHIGPLARILVKKIAKTTDDIRLLYEQLGETLTDHTLRAQFLSHMPAASTISAYKKPEEDSPISGSPEVKVGKDWDDQELKRIELHLARHLGPLSRVLVSQAANEATTIKELYDLLAAHLDKEEERWVFMKTMH